MLLYDLGVDFTLSVKFAHLPSKWVSEQSSLMTFLGQQTARSL